MPSKLIGHAWISGRETIGVVVSYDDVTCTFKSRIRPVKGEDQEADLWVVEQTGTTIPISLGFQIVDDLGMWTDNDLLRKLKADLLGTIAAKIDRLMDRAA